MGFWAMAPRRSWRGRLQPERHHAEQFGLQDRERQSLERMQPTEEEQSIAKIAASSWNLYRTCEAFGLPTTRLIFTMILP